tara:strand:- start:259 stop:669 length:411 start_codon:yes stop_codon:yes gene_type:complete
MATFTSDQINGNQTFKPFPDGNLGIRYAKFSVTAAPNTDDIYQMVDVFAGETVHNVKIKSTDLDTGTDLVYGVGDATDADQYIAASACGQAGGGDESDANVSPNTYSSDDTIDITVEVDPAGDVATGTLEMWVTIS